MHAPAPRRPDPAAGGTVDGLAGALFELGRLFLRLAPRDLSLTVSSTLVALVDDGPLRITALAEREGVTQPSMSELVNRLHAAGLVVRHRDPEDRRAVMVAATPAGTTLVENRRSERARRFADLIGSLSPGDLQALAAAETAIRRLVEHGTPEARPPGGRPARKAPGSSG